MPPDANVQPEPVDPRRITSLELEKGPVIACWGLGLTAVAAGGAATFVRDNQAGSAALILFGSVLVLLALMRRVPLRFEVGNTKLDATYELDRAFEAGHEGGVVEGLTVVADDLRELVDDDAASAVNVARVLRHLEGRLRPPALTELRPEEHDARGGYPRPVVCAATATTYRQLDYWVRTHLIVPSVRQSEDPERSLFSFRDVLTVALIKRLLNAGVALQNIRQMIKATAGLPLADLRTVTLISDGLNVHACRTSAEVLAHIDSGKAAAVVAVAPLWDDLNTTLSQFPSEEPR